MSSTVRFGFTGDVMLGRQVDRRQQSRSADAVWGDLLGRLQSLDGLFINLECCLSTRGQPWRRTYRPFHFRANPTWAIPALERAGVDCASLANNHALDYGVRALCDTLDHLDRGDIASPGGGRTMRAAREPSHVFIEGMNVAVISFTDNTPEYAADSDTPGISHTVFDLENEPCRKILGEALTAAQSAEPDLLVASLHWGPNMVTKPPDAFRAVGHWLIERGVDLVHGHSAHIFQGIEIHEGCPILYDVGDFVDDYAVDDDLRNDRGFLFELQTDREGSLRALRLLPIEIRDCAVHRAGSTAADWSRDRIRELSKPFGTEFERQEDELILPLESRCGGRTTTDS
ncbi:CapA family protein [Halocatena marina]|uniref:CapA family protein n=1 Tax=Halocatena marina TaxID=2934937 RepID=A0ABD5YIG9_9EURY|nr:CapA family protein [Halocatena marina]